MRRSDREKRAGVLLIAEQRPSSTLPGQDEYQFRRYVFTAFGEIIQVLLTQCFPISKSSNTSTLLAEDIF